jgi:Ni/Fe-hydrogenase 1 B-type cytochrome subunit
MTAILTPADPSVRSPEVGGPPPPAARDVLHIPEGLERVRVYVWEVPVRVTHWVTFSAILVLTVTGAYIADPFFFAFNVDTMRIVRSTHLLAAWVFLASGLVRTYWLFAGNQFARWRAFIPTNRKHLSEVRTQTAFYSFLSKDLPGVLGHNALAGGTYLVVFFLFLIQTVTGFGMAALHGTQPFATLFGWVPSIMFGEQGMRLVHHLLMWAIIAFAVHHVYSAILVDHWERNGLMSSIFAGSKFVPRWRIDEARDGGIEFEQIVSRSDVETSVLEAIEAGQPVSRTDAIMAEEAIAERSSG